MNKRETLYLTKDNEISNLSPSEKVDLLLGKLNEVTSLDNLNQAQAEFSSVEEAEWFINRIKKGELNAALLKFANAISKDIDEIIEYLVNENLSEESLNYYNEIHDKLLDLRDIIMEMKLRSEEILELEDVIIAMVKAKLDREVASTTQDNKSPQKRNKSRKIRLPRKMQAAAAGLVGFLSFTAVGNAVSANDAELQFKNENVLPLCDINLEQVGSIENHINEILQTQLELIAYWNHYCSGHENAMQSSTQETAPQNESLNIGQISFEIRMDNGEYIDSQITIDDIHDKYPNLIDTDLISNWLNRFISEANMPEEVLSPENLQIVLNIPEISENASDSDIIDAIAEEISNNKTYFLRLESKVSVSEPRGTVIHEQGNYIILINTEFGAYIPQGQLLNELQNASNSIYIPEFDALSNFDTFLNLEKDENAQIIRILIFNEDTGEVTNDASLSIPDLLKNGGYGPGSIILHEGVEVTGLIFSEGNETTSPDAIATPTGPRRLMRNEGEVTRVEEEEVETALPFSSSEVEALDVMREGEYHLVVENSQVRIYETDDFYDRHHRNFDLTAEEQISYNPILADETFWYEWKAMTIQLYVNANASRLNVSPGITTQEVLDNHEYFLELLKNETISLNSVSSIQSGEGANEMSFNQLWNNKIVILRLGNNHHNAEIEGLIKNDINPGTYSFISEEGELVLTSYSPAMTNAEIHPKVSNPNPNGQIVHLEDYLEASAVQQATLIKLDIRPNDEGKYSLDILDPWLDLN